MAEDGGTPNTVRFELVAPERVLASEDVDMVVVPGAEGDFGVLPNHAPLLATLRPGVISVYKGDAVDRRVFVAGGFAEVNAKGCTVLAEDARPVDEIDAAEARSSLDEALKAEGDAPEDETEAAMRRVAVAQARVDASA